MPTTIDKALYRAVEEWLKSVKGIKIICQNVRTEVKLPPYPFPLIPPSPSVKTIDIIGGGITGESIERSDILIYAVKVRRQRATGLLEQLQKYKETIRELSWFPIPGYGKYHVGPDKLFIYACIPRRAVSKTLLDHMRSRGFGLLTFSGTNKEARIDEVLRAQEHNIGSSSRIKRNLAMFDTLCRYHPIYKRLFPRGRIDLGKAWIAIKR